jgi:hypothetical protein
LLPLLKKNMDIEKIVFYKESNILIVEGANFKGFNLIE